MRIARFSISTVSVFVIDRNKYYMQTYDASYQYHLNLFRFLYIADNHDIWHFFSAAGIFMVFLALLTVDDDLLATERNLIEVF